MLVEKILQPMLIGLKLPLSIRTSSRRVCRRNSRLRLSWRYLLYPDDGDIWMGRLNGVTGVLGTSTSLVLSIHNLKSFVHTCSPYPASVLLA